MVLVDTTVWVDFFAGTSAPHVTALERLPEQGEDVCICRVILKEVLQAIRADKEYRKVRNRFEDLIFLPMTRSAFVRAAELYRSLPRKGVTVRKPVDCMIASVAIEHDVPLLHNDRDFRVVERHGGWQVWRGAAKS